MFFNLFFLVIILFLFCIFFWFGFLFRSLLKYCNLTSSFSFSSFLIFPQINWKKSNQKINQKKKLHSNSPSKSHFPSISHSNVNSNSNSSNVKNDLKFNSFQIQSQRRINQTFSPYNIHEEDEVEHEDDDEERLSFHLKRKPGYNPSILPSSIPRNNKYMLVSNTSPPSSPNPILLNNPHLNLNVKHHSPHHSPPIYNNISENCQLSNHRHHNNHHHNNHHNNHNNSNDNIYNQYLYHGGEDDDQQQQQCYEHHLHFNDVLPTRPHVIYFSN